METTRKVTPLDPLTALTMELGRAVEPVEILEWFVYGVPTLSRRAAEILRTANVDRMLAGLEATLMEKLQVQEAVYDRLAGMLDGRDADLAFDILVNSTSPEAGDL